MAGDEVDWRALNGADWDSRLPVHVASSLYDLPGFRAGASSLRPFEVAEVGSVAGRSLVHLRCHIGLDTLSWARLDAFQRFDFLARDEDGLFGFRRAACNLSRVSGIWYASGLATGGGRVGATEEFTEFAVGAAPRLRRTAFLLCGDWHTAEDLTQTTLARMFVSWRRISRRDAVYAYASRTLVNAFLADRRRRRGRELLTGWLPERPDPAAVAAPETRMVVLDALATLPPRTRVVVVMRYWDDLSVEQVAHLLGCTTGNVKSQSARGLARLRAVLGSSVLDQPRERRDARRG